MIHQPLIQGGLSGKATEILIYAKHMDRSRTALYNILSKHTKQSSDIIAAACERDNWLNAQEAVDFGICDKIVTKH
jgi:ATP-dependent Clp protease protease subunit